MNIQLNISNYDGKECEDVFTFNTLGEATYLLQMLGDTLKRYSAEIYLNNKPLFKVTRLSSPGFEERIQYITGAGDALNGNY